MTTYIENFYNKDGTVNINLVMSSAQILKIEQLTTNSKIFPNPDIVNFIAFSGYEQDLLTSLYDNFTSKDSYMALLAGNPSSGKSIFSYKLGIKIKEHLGQNNVYYIDITKAPIDIDRHIDLLNNENSYFIIDNIHLNTELSYKVYINFEQKKSKILFVGRNIDKKFFEIEDIGEDIYAIFENKNEQYRLKSFNKKDEKDSILEKTKAIINAFKQLNNIQAEIGDDDAVVNMIGDNFVLLYYYLGSWKEQPTVLFASLTKEQLLSRVWNKITNEILKDKTDIEKLLSVAVLYQYEICAHKANSKALLQRGLTHVQSAGYDYEEPCSLYHSNYAKLVIDAYCETSEFKRSGQTKEDLNIKYLKGHLEDNYSVISLSDELVKLRNNYEYQLLSRLLSEIDKQKVKEYFVAPNDKTTMADFTKVINILMSFNQSDLADDILQSLIEKEFDRYDLSGIGLLSLLVFVGKEQPQKKKLWKVLQGFFGQSIKISPLVHSILPALDIFFPYWLKIIKI